MIDYQVVQTSGGVVAKERPTTLHELRMQSACRGMKVKLEGGFVSAYLRTSFLFSIMPVTIARIIAIAPMAAHESRMRCMASVWV